MKTQEKTLENILAKLNQKTGLQFTQSQIAKTLDVSRQYISQMKGKEMPLNYIEQLENVYAVKLLDDHANDCIELDFYPNVFGSCGNGLTIFDESSEKITITKDIIDGYSTAYNYSVISARGSSMSPVINDDDRLVVQMQNGEQIIDNSIYIFRYNDELFIKRLVKNIDQIVCISENPRFDDRIIDPAKCEFSIIGKIVGLFRSKV